MPRLSDPLMIVTDLDGSLLDHHTYSWQPAQSWLDRLTAADIPVVICSSKTAAEIIPLQRALGISGMPFISENGAIVDGGSAGSVPPVVQQGKDYAGLCDTLQRLRSQYDAKFTGFADVTQKEVADWTGLSLHDALLAKQRQGSESIIWRDSPEKFTLFQHWLADEGLELVQGGRFWHVMNQGGGKGAALAWLLEHLSPPSSSRYLTVGLGDGPNDAPMLESTDYAVIIKGYSKTPIGLLRNDNENIFHSTHYGPQGWSEGLTHFITGD
ncbi:mannosyl-3-phosphoglycerate phosphatase-related protein [Erwinia tasmaniensis]|uniref:mannosyl-3-phosphoglycerate phosphatase-related protein n=1 Tax=Erwinia tasmaniensis TaxID=338565 RepID=UPI003A4DFFA3